MKVSTEQVITRSKIRLGLLDTTMADPFIEKFIEEGARHLDALTTYVISCETLPIDCFMATLPSNIKSEDDVICMKFGNGTCCGACGSSDAGDSNAYTNITNAMSCGCYQWYIPNRQVLTNFCGQGANAAYCGNTFDIQGGYIKFPTTLTSTSVTIWYHSYNTDGDGIMVLNELQERGLSAYAAFNYAMSGQNYKSYSPTQISKWEKEWIAQKNWLKGKDVLNDHRLHKAEFSAIARAILINPLIALNRNA